MSSKGCNISTKGTGISLVEIKTKPLTSPLDYFFVIAHVVIGYIDLIFDILAIIALSSSDIPIMTANISFIVLNVALGVWMSRNDAMDIIRTLLQVDPLYQGYKTFVAGHQTSEMIVSKKIDAVTRSLPSMVLQLYGLLKSLASPDTSGNSFLDTFLSPNQILLLSIASSIIGAGFTLASLSPNSGHSIFNIHFIIHYAYYIVEITNRIVILSVMFFTVNAYGFIVAYLDFHYRLSTIREESGGKKVILRDRMLIAIQSFGSDHTLPGRYNVLLYFGFAFNTIEMIIFLIVLNTLKTPPLDVARSQGASSTLTVVACITWVIRLVFYYTRVLDIAPARPPSPLKKVPLNEEDIVKDNDYNSNSILSVNEIEVSRDMV